MMFFVAIRVFIYNLERIEKLSESNIEPQRKDFLNIQRTKKNTLNNTVVQNETKFLKEQSNDTWPLSSHVFQNKIKQLCFDVPTFDAHKHAIISTFDLSDITNYTLQADKNYVFTLPDREVAYKADLNHLNIIIVPFSHVDPGYGMSFEQYYRLYVKGILNSMVEKLSAYPDMTFQWAEVVFLERWWRDIDVNTKMLVRNLVRRGQLEIVLGGWVMPDEAVTTVEGLVGQLLEGHQWVQDKLGATPETSWSNDPFGYSEVMSHILRSSGIKNMVILRIHQAIKATLVQLRALEFTWRPYLSSGADSDILCHIMPYTGYWIRDVCGPDKELCKEYAFMHTVGENLPVWITDDNVAERAKLLYEQYRITAELYKFNTLYIGLGEDFSYSKSNDWDLIYTNFKKLMHFMNKQKSWNVTIKFGTIREYFNIVKENDQHFPSKYFPIISGDFFPYSDWNNEYWTGYYTSRPFQKQFLRDLGRIISIADVYLVFRRSHSQILKNKMAASEILELELSLRGARREYLTFQHHDAITGTSTQEVTRQYDIKLYQAYMKAMSVLRRLVTILMLKDNTFDIHVDVLECETFRMKRDLVAEKIPININENGTQLYIINPLPRERTEVVSFHSISDKIKVSCPTFGEIKMQLNSIAQGLSSRDSSGYEVVFALTLPPYAIESVNTFVDDDFSNQVKHYNDAKNGAEQHIVIKGQMLSAKFNATTGMLVSITDQNMRETKIDAMFYWYESIKSGAYVFKPLTEAVPMNLDFQQTSVLYLQGELVSEVRVLYAEGLFQSYKIYNTSTLQGHGLHIHMEINIQSSAAFWANKEVVFRIMTDVQNNGHFYTDQNGLHVIGRKTLESMPVGSKFYPITKMVILEDRTKRLTLHTAQPHGAASLNNGWLEIMLDRTMVTDDHKGLGQGVIDNRLTTADFILKVEYKETEFDIKEERYTYETQLESLINENLQHPVILLYKNRNEVPFSDHFRPLVASLPCDTSIIGLRNLVTEELKYTATSLMLYRKSFYCGFPAVDFSCHATEPVTLHSIFPFDNIELSDESTLTHLHKKASISKFEDLRPVQNKIRSFKVEIPLR